MISHPGFVIWLTGLPGSGKTTIATRLHQRLAQLGCNCVNLDGDVIRNSRRTPLGFSQKDRNINVEQAALTARLLMDAGLIVITALISPYRDTRDFAVRQTQALEVFVDAPLEECMRRDPKGLYARGRRGEVANMTGLADPYEPPTAPALHLRTDQEDCEKCVERIMELLYRQGLLDDIRQYMDNVYQPTEEERRGAQPGEHASGLRGALPPFRKLFIAGLPKSGTTWLQGMLTMLPGFHSRPILDPTRAVYFHDVTPTMFQLLPPEELLVLKFHTRYTPYNLHTLKTHVGKIVVLFRDLRDVVISRYYHVLNEPGHRHREMYLAGPREEALLHCINIVKIDYFKWVQDWACQARLHPETILPLTYEEMHRSPAEAVRRICRHYAMPDPDAGLLERMVGSRMTTPENLAQSLAAGQTKRKGTPGDWKNHFTDRHKETFKSFAGELLVNLGYEKDQAW